MYFDAFTASAILQELRQYIVGGRVQEIAALDPLGIGMEFYVSQSRRYLVLSAHPQLARVHLVTEKTRRGIDTPSPFVLLLKKWVRDARLVAVEQPPLERILCLHFDHPVQGVSWLMAECMGRHSNLILIDGAGIILDAIKRVGPEVNRYRTILPRQLYIPPPVQNKLPPYQVTESRLEELLRACPANTPVWKQLVASISGMSPLLAREICYRAYGDATIPCADTNEVMPLLSALGGILSRFGCGIWEPCTGSLPSREQGGAEELADHGSCFAPYPLTHLPQWEPAPSMSEAISKWLSGQTSLATDAYRPAREQVLAKLTEAIRRVERRRSQLREQITSAQETESLRLSGELILAYGWHNVPGQRTLAIDLEEGRTLTIEMDPNLSPAENAQRYFERYSKAKRAASEVPALLERADQELEWFRQLEFDLQMASNRSEIDAIEAELAARGYLEPQKAVRKRPLIPSTAGILSVKTSAGNTIWIGRNSRQNELVTFRMAAPDDMWFHARGRPGAHVVLRLQGKQPSEACVQRAAELAAYHSAGRSERKVQVDFTFRRYVRRRPKGLPGQVVYRNESTIIVEPKP